MSKFTSPEMCEPSQGLKQEFREAIEKAIPEGELTASFPLTDGRVLELWKPAEINPNSEDDYHIATFKEDISNPQGKVTHNSILYCLTQDNVIDKLFITEEEQEPDLKVQSQWDQVMAAMRTHIQELIAMGLSEEQAMRMAAEASVLKTINIAERKPLTDLFNEAMAAGAEEALGINQVSGVELQNIIDEIKNTTGQNG